MSNLPYEDGVMRTGAAAKQTRRGAWVLAATILASSMVFIDGTVVNVALPALQSALNATVTDVQWVVEAYALFLAALLLVGGGLGDLYGRRKVFLIGVVLFAGASACCGFALGIRSLIVARGFQGVGGALLVPGSLALISSSFGDEERGRAIGTWSGFTAMTTALGPVLGGWLIEHLSWRWVFFINLPLAVFVVAISLARVPESRDEEMVQRLDGWGALLATVGLCGITFALIEAGRGAERALIAGGVGVMALAGFFVVEWRSDAPMLPLNLFRSSSFSGANLVTLFLYGAAGAMMFFLPMDLIQVQHYSATEAGAALLPLILLMFCVVAMVGRVDRSIWCKAAAYRRAVDCWSGICVIYARRDRWVVLVDSVSSSSGARLGDGGERSSADDDGDEFDRSEPGGSSFGDQQCGIAGGGSVGDCCAEAYVRYEFR